MSAGLPSVLGLFEYLADEKVTTMEQRVQLRSALNDYLNNDIPQSKLYTSVGQIVGHQLLYEIIRKLKTPDVEVEPVRRVKKDELLAADSSRVQYSSLAKADQIRKVPCWMEDVATTPGLFWSLAGQCTSPFIALGHLLDNSCQSWVAATRVDVDIAVDPAGKIELCVQDDGSGLSYKEFHGALKKVAEFRPTNIKSKPWVYGLGFKIAFARLGLGALLITQNEQMVGLGLCSLPLMGHVSSDKLIAPAVVWKLPEKTLVNNGYPAVNQRQTQKLVMQYSPYKSPSSLATQIRKLGTEPGTRVIIFDLRDDFPGFTVDQGTGRVMHAAFTEGKTCVTADSLPTDLKYAEDAAKRRDIVGDIDKGFLPETFPFWSRAEDGIDGCLATFLFWARLHKKCVIHLGGVPLSVPEEEGSDDSGFAGGLYRVLKKKLHHSVEVANIFEGGHGSHTNLQCVGLIGFLNPARAERVLGLEQTSEDNGLLETGVLLYHQDRFICRLEVPLHDSPERIRLLGDEGVFGLPPVTCVLNVPDWLLPSCSKSAFVHEGSRAWREAKSRMDSVLREYVDYAHTGTFQGWKYYLRTQLEQ